MGRPLSNRKCTVVDCNNKHEAKGLCNKHYLCLLRLGKPDLRKIQQPILRGSTYKQPLSNREKQVLKLMQEGLRQFEVARQLNINFRTVHTYRQRLSEKLYG